MSKTLRWGEAPGAWLALIACTVTIVLGAGTRSSFGVFLRPIEEDLGLNRFETSMAGTLMQLCYGLSLPMLGYLATRYGARTVMFCGVVLMSAGGLGMAAIREPPELYLFGGIFPGLGFAAACHIVAAVLLARWFRSRLGVATGIVSSAVPGGQAIFVPFSAALIPLIGWRSTYLILSLLMAVVALPLLWWLARDPAASAARPVQVARRPSPGIGRDIWMLGIGSFGCGFTDQLVTVHFIALAAESGIEPLLAAGLFSLMLLSGVAGSVLSGPLADVWQARWQLSLHFALRILSLPALLFAGPGERIWILCLFAVVFGSTYIANQAPTARQVRDGYGIGSVGRLMGSLGMVHQLGGAVGIAVGGVSVVATGSYAAAIAIATGIATLSAVSQLFIPAKRLVRL